MSPQRTFTMASTGRKSPSVCRAGMCGFALAGGQLSTGPPLPQLPPLAAGAVLRGKEAFPVSPPPNFPAFLASPEKRQQEQGGGPATNPLAGRCTGLGHGGREHMVPREGRWGQGLACGFPPLGCLPGGRTGPRDAWATAGGGCPQGCTHPKAALTPMEGFRAVAKQHADTAYREVPGGQEFG